MNYQKILNNIILGSMYRHKIRGDGLHRHRLIPGFLGGKYIKENIVYLTRKEHKIVHKIRYKLFGYWQDISSYIKLGGINGIPWNKGKKGVQIPWNKGKYTPLKGKTYEDIYGVEKAQELKEIRRKFILENPYMQTKESREKRHKSLILFYKNNVSPAKGISKTPEHRKKLSESLKGKKHTIQTKRKMSESRLGNKSNTGKHWYNNGIKQGLFFEVNKPENWIQGRLM